ncbi:MAG: hypothetical protein ACREQV_01555 [Candidatus Binatia bacterium]
MGSALESAEDRDDKEAIQQMTFENAPGTDARRDIDLALRKSINAAIFEGQEMAPIRNTIKAAIARRVKEEVLEKYEHWKNEDKRDPNKWPFK